MERELGGGLPVLSHKFSFHKGINTNYLPFLTYALCMLSKYWFFILISRVLSFSPCELRLRLSKSFTGKSGTSHKIVSLLPLPRDL